MLKFWEFSNFLENSLFCVRAPSHSFLWTFQCKMLRRGTGKTHHYTVSKCPFKGGKGEHNFLPYRPYGRKGNKCFFKPHRPGALGKQLKNRCFFWIQHQIMDTKPLPRNSQNQHRTRPNMIDAKPPTMVLTRTNDTIARNRRKKRKDQATTNPRNTT